MTRKIHRYIPIHTGGQLKRVVSSSYLGQMMPQEGTATFASKVVLQNHKKTWGVKKGVDLIIPEKNKKYVHFNLGIEKRESHRL